MGFDWKGFATGFLEGGAENLRERKKEARDYEERQRALAERNVQTISKRRAIANQVTGLTNMLRENGASDRIIQAAVASGPKEVAKLANAVDEARRKTGGKLGAEEIEALVRVPEGFSPLDMDTEAFIRQTYGLGYQGAGTTEEMPERTLMDRITGRKQMDMARARLDREVIQDGLTAYDINQMAAQQDYESLVPGTFISFNDVQMFNPAKDMAGFTRTMTNLVSDVQDSAAFKQIQQAMNNLTISDLSEEETSARISELEKQRDELYLRTVAPTINSMVSTYGESFVDATSGYLRGFLSDDYVDSLSFEPELEEEDTAEAADQTTEALGEPATATSIVTPEVEVTALPEEEEPEAETPTEAEAEELQDEGLEPDDMSVALLNSDGTDIMTYLKDKGVTSEEEMVIAINEWAQENSKIVPLDKGVLIYALKPYVLEQ